MSDHDTFNLHEVKGELQCCITGLSFSMAHLDILISCCPCDGVITTAQSL